MRSPIANRVSMNGFYCIIEIALTAAYLAVSFRRLYTSSRIG
jgi:hypothetical protein